MSFSCRLNARSFLISFVLSLVTFWDADRPEAKNFNPDNPLNTPAPIYWCPDKTRDQQISAKPKGTCRPLYDKREDESFREEAKRLGYDLPDRVPIKIVDLQSAAARFSDRYRHFLTCCVTDDEAPREIFLLIDEANHLLHAVQHNGIFNAAGFGIGSGDDGLGGGVGEAPKLGTFARQFTLSEIVGTVVRAREDLISLRQRLERLGDLQQNLDGQDYETAGRTRLLIQEEEEAIRRDFRAKQPPSSAPTGMDIQDTTLPTRIGGDIEETMLNSHFGADIGAAVSPYSNVNESLRPRRGEAVHDSLLPHRPGTEMEDTSLPNSTGFEIDRTQNPDGTSTLPLRGVGPSIGDSDLNRRR
ncbi:MAG: hypothetical protein NNA20_01815 [Nitrospira sp.]|nr:hypothetical protein [Nitrospira sp.]MCP9441307.1 hypothetical protein [Nitrospira sp.]